MTNEEMEKEDFRLFLRTMAEVFLGVAVIVTIVHYVGTWIFG